MASITPFVPRDLGPKDWGTELLVAETESFTGKVLFMHAGGKGGLQYHEKKPESFYLFSGRALVRYDEGDGRLICVEMNPGQAFHVPVGAVHQVEALTECVFFEASVPVFDDRVNVEHLYEGQDPAPF